MMQLRAPGHDPIGVLTTTLPVVETATNVHIAFDKIDAVAAQLSAPDEVPEWDGGHHIRDGTWKTAGWILALDALNFCFWSADPDPARRWRVVYGGEEFDGYWALVAALRRAVDEGKPLWDPSYLAGLTARDVAHILRPPHSDLPEIPLLPLRVQNLHELGRGLIAAFPDRIPVAELLTRCERSAVALVHEMTSLFPSFNDVATYDGQPVRLLKRAQILAADLHGAFEGTGLGQFDDLDQLSAFADYKVPQVLRRFGLLNYSDDLAGRIRRRELIPAGSPAEVEIRAATVWCCELLRRAMVARGQQIRAFEVDWSLWNAGQTLPPETEPYHRTYTVFY